MAYSVLVVCSAIGGGPLMVSKPASKLFSPLTRRKSFRRSLLYRRQTAQTTNYITHLCGTISYQHYYDVKLLPAKS